jgi:hypothetical protein
MRRRAPRNKPRLGWVDRLPSLRGASGRSNPPPGSRCGHAPPRSRCRGAVPVSTADRRDFWCMGSWRDWHRPASRRDPPLSLRGASGRGNPRPVSGAGTRHRAHGAGVLFRFPRRTAAISGAWAPGAIGDDTRSALVVLVRPDAPPARVQPRGAMDRACVPTLPPARDGAPDIAAPRIEAPGLPPENRAGCGRKRNGRPRADAVLFLG